MNPVFARRGLSASARGVAFVALAICGTDCGNTNVLDESAMHDSRGASDVVSGDAAPGDALGDNARNDAASGVVETAPARDPKFTDVTAAMGLPTAGTTCLSARDFDHDGRTDLLLGSPDNQGRPTMTVWAQRGDSFRAYPLGIQPGALCAAGDLDGDGWVDIVTTGVGPGRSNVLILHNRGTTGFEFDDVSSGVENPVGERIWIAGFVDADGDGRIDIVVGPATNSGPGSLDRCAWSTDDFACYFTASAPTPPRLLLLRNKNAGSYTTDALPGATAEYLNSVGTVDWDEDGDADLLLGVDFGRNQFLLSFGGDYRDALPGWGANPYNHAMGTAFADFDRDGRWDYFVTDIGPSQLWYGTADGVRNRAAELGISATTRRRYSWAAIAADLDNNGADDVYVLNSVIATTDSALQSYVSTDGQSVPAGALAPLVDDVFMGSPAGFDHAEVAHRAGVQSGGIGVAAAGDFDGDGRIDLAVALARTYEFRLLLNRTSTRGYHWLGVSLRGAGGNRDAIGATVYALDAEGHEIGRKAPAAGGLASSDAVLHFGLGARDSVASLRVRWPGGRVQEVPGPIAADQTVKVEAP